MKYESLHADVTNALLLLSEFITEEPVFPESLEKAVAAAQFEVMHEREKSGHYAEIYGSKLTISDKISNHPEAYKSRQGKVCGYVNYLSA